jgi:nitric oxide reductase NorQ protein
MSDITKNYVQQDDEMDHLDEIITCAESGKATGLLLWGPPGTGKTLLATTLARRNKSKYFIIDGSPQLDRRDLEGTIEIRKGETVFFDGPLTQAIKEAKENKISFLIINEINAIRESEQVSLNSLLSESHINLISKNGERIELDEDCKLIVIGTMNKGVLGINQLQEAFDDRFILEKKIGYPSKNVEMKIITKITGCKRDLAKLTVELAKELRKGAEKYVISKMFSTRMAVNFCSMISKMGTKFLRQNIKSMIIHKLSQNEEEYNYVSTMIDGKLFEDELTKVLEPPKKVEESKVSSEPIGISTLFTKPAGLAIDESNAIDNMKKVVDECKMTVGLWWHSKIMWKSLEWIWKNHKRVLQRYFELGDKIGFFDDYSKETGKDPFYSGQLTQSAIYWVFNNRYAKIEQFMVKIYPVCTKI